MPTVVVMHKKDGELLVVAVDKEGSGGIGECQRFPIDIRIGRASSTLKAIIILLL